MEDEEMYENSCEECANKEIHSVSLVHCFECDLRMCVTCKNKHSRSRVKKKHHFIRIDDAPEGVLLSFLKSFRICSCQLTEVVVFQCNSHDVMCCPTCAMEAHKGCDVVSIADASKRAKEMGLDRSALNDSDKLEERNRTLLEAKVKKKKSGKKDEAASKKNIRELKEYIDSKFDDFTREIEIGVEVNGEDSCILRKNLTIKEYMNRKLKEVLTLSMESTDDTRTYLNIKAMQKILNDFKTSLDDIDKDAGSPNFENLKQRIDDAFTQNGQRSLVNKAKEQPSTSRDGVSQSDTNYRKPILMQSFPLDDIVTFNDSTWMNEEHIVLTDSSSKRLYSYYVYQNTVECHMIALPTLPWCVEALDVDTVAVSFHSEKMIRLYKIVPGKAREVEKLYVFNMCFDMHYVKEETALYVLFKNICGYRSAEIEKFALDPRKLGTFDPDDDMHIGKKLGALDLGDEASLKLAKSNAFRVTRDRKLLILACATHEICFIDMKNGSIISKYDPDMFNPVFVDTDNNGYIYVVWTTNSTIHMLSRNGEFIREILTGQDGLALPSRLYFNNDCDKFIVIDQNRRKQLKLFNYS